MNRRSFIKTLSAAVAVFTVLPSATTYARKWVQHKEALWVPNPEYVKAPYEIAFDIELKPMVYRRNVANWYVPRIYGELDLPCIREAFPARFALDPNGNKVFIPPYVRV